MITFKPLAFEEFSAIWPLMEPVIREGHTYALPRDMTMEAAAAHWFRPGNQVFVARIIEKDSNAAQSTLEKLIHEATESKDNAQKIAILGDVSPWLEDAARARGLDVRGYQHRIDSYAIKHINASHGNKQTESRRGQIAVTLDDIKRIPELLSAPDKVIFGLRNKIGRDVIAYLKRLADGSTLYLEEVRSGSKGLFANSMRRYLPTIHDDAVANTLLHTRPSRLREAEIIITHLPKNTSAINANAAQDIVSSSQTDPIAGTFYIRPNFPGGGSHVANAGFMVDSAHRGRGVARAMCVEALRLADAQGYRAMQFNFVVSSNTVAVHVWKTCGFREIGRIPGGYLHASGDYVDVLILYREL